MEFDGRHLRVVRAIADHGSVTKAAAALGMSQPALTRQLQRLERALGAPLFVRGGNGSTPTELGSYVLARARAVLPVLDDLNNQAVRQAAGSGNLSRIRVGGVIGPLSAGLLPYLRELEPAAEVTLVTEHSSATLCDLVAGGRLDLAATLEFPGHEVPAKPGLVHHVVATEPVFVLLAPDHPAAARAEVPLAELANQDWVLRPHHDNGFRTYFADACRETGFTPVVRYEADSATATELICGGDAIGCGQACYWETAGEVVMALTDTPLWARHLLVWRRNGPLDAVASALIQSADRTYWASARRSPTYRAWLARQGRTAHEVDAT